VHRQVALKYSVGREAAGGTCYGSWGYGTSWLRERLAEYRLEQGGDYVAQRRLERPPGEYKPHEHGGCSLELSAIIDTCGPFHLVDTERYLWRDVCVGGEKADLIRCTGQQSAGQLHLR
jgi:hypothetical protein